MRLALYQPEIPQNTGTLMRLGVCLDIEIDIIGPCGFVLSNYSLKRAGMDYLNNAKYIKHQSWSEFYKFTQANKYSIVYVTPNCRNNYYNFQFHNKHILLVGSESSGIPAYIVAQIKDHVKIPMQQGQRSLNVAIAASVVLCEAMRQTKSFPGDIA